MHSGHMPLDFAVLHFENISIKINRKKKKPCLDKRAMYPLHKYSLQAGSRL